MRHQVHTHSYGGYSNGCRCDVCREAKATRMREYRTRARRALQSTGTGRNFVPGIKHGYSGYQNHACRCEVCTRARAERDSRRTG